MTASTPAASTIATATASTTASITGTRNPSTDGTPGAAPGDTTLSQERCDLLQALAAHRHFLRQTARGLTDAQARHRSTVSELTIGGLIKHVSQVEGTWARFILEGSSAFTPVSDAAPAEFADGFRLLEGETLAGALDAYREVAARTDELVRTVDLDGAQPLPEAPWFPREQWTARRVMTHIIAETAQHAGHADIVREAIDGAKSMG